jgi:tetratricopeptide (TPR) repeat protein
MFLLVECNFILREFENTIAYTNKMLDLYPENELTGFAMLRLGKVYEEQDRLEDAIEIYKTLLNTFPNRGVASAARNSLRSVEL